MEPWALTTAILFILFVFVSFFGIPIEASFSKSLKVDNNVYFTISENYAKSKVMKWVIAAIGLILLITFPVGIFYYVRCNVPQSLYAATAVAALASLAGFLTLITLKWIKTTSHVHMTMAVLTFVLASLTLWVAAGDVKTYVLSGVGSIGLLLSIVFGAKSMDINMQGGGDHMNGVWVALGEFLLVISISVFMFVAAQSDDECEVL